MADYDFEAWAQSRVASSKPNPNQQAAASMRSVGIGGLGGKATTSSAQRIQDSFREMRENSRTSGSTNKSYFGDINTAGLGSPLSLKETEKKDDRNLDQKIYDGMKAFGARLFPPRKESTSDYVLDVYETSPMFRIPTVPEVTELGIEKSFEQRLQEMFSSQGQNVYTPEIEGTGSNDEVPATTDYQNLMRNRINSILKDVIAPNSKEYEIQKGDTLSDISLREGVNIDDLAKVNEIENPNMILAGGTLIIPEAQEMEKAKEYVLRVTTRGDENLVDETDPERQFYQSGVPMDQRIFEPESPYLDNQPQEKEGLMSTEKSYFADINTNPITGTDESYFGDITGQGIMSPPTTLTAEQRTAMSDTGSDVMGTKLHKITNARGNYSQTALTNAIDKGVRDETKRALLKGASQTEIGEAEPRDEGRWSRGNINGLSRGRLAVGDKFEGRELTANDPMVGQFKHAWRRRMIRDGVMAEDGTLINYSGTNVFNSVYSNRNGNGDYASGDGDTYRGRGLIQITGRGTYQAVDDILKRDGINIDLVDNPNLANDTRYALPVAMAYLEYAGLDDEAAANSSAKDLNNKVNPREDAGVAERRWNNVVSNLSGDEATRMENRNEYAAQRTVGLRGGNVDGAVGNQTRPRLRAWLNERNITIPENATDMDLVVLVNENS